VFDETGVGVGSSLGSVELVSKKAIKDTLAAIRVAVLSGVS